jgi:hypothetical protein
MENHIDNSQFLYIVSLNTNNPMVTRNAYISPSEKDTSYALKTSTSSEICKLLKVNRIIFIRAKPSAKILTLNKVFNLYNIPNNLRKLRIKINDNFIEYPETLLISLKEIESVQILKNANPYYIHITEKGYLESKKYFERLKKQGEIFVK